MAEQQGEGAPEPQPEVQPETAEPAAAEQAPDLGPSQTAATVEPAPGLPIPEPLDLAVEVLNFEIRPNVGPINMGFPKHQGTQTSSPSSRSLIIITPTKKDPQFREAAIYFKPRGRYD